MKKYFVMSDIHSFYTEMMKALNDAGFDLNNDEHILIICGDLFDRGYESTLLYNFIHNTLPKNRRVLIRGNHEYLLRDLMRKVLPDDYDYSNGTVRTCCNLTNEDEIDVMYSSKTFSKVKKKIQELGLVEWTMSDEWKNYYEIQNLILVHSFIPLKKELSKTDEWSSVIKYTKNWRKSSKRAFIEASWNCPWKLFKEGYFDKEIEQGKVLVCGHWHTTDFYKHLDNIYDESFKIYHNKNLIALDACTALSHHCNVLIIEEYDNHLTLKDRFNNEIKL